MKMGELSFRRNFPSENPKPLPVSGAVFQIERNEESDTWDVIWHCSSLADFMTALHQHSDIAMSEEGLVIEVPFHDGTLHFRFLKRTVGKTPANRSCDCCYQVLVSPYRTWQMKHVSQDLNVKYEVWEKGWRTVEPEMFPIQSASDYYRITSKTVENAWWWYEQSRERFVERSTRNRIHGLPVYRHNQHVQDQEIYMWGLAMQLEIRHKAQEAIRAINAR